MRLTLDLEAARRRGAGRRGAGRVEDAREEVGERAVESVRVRAEVLKHRVEERVLEAQVGLVR